MVMVAQECECAECHCLIYLNIVEMVTFLCYVYFTRTTTTKAGRSRGFRNWSKPTHTASLYGSVLPNITHEKLFGWGDDQRGLGYLLPLLHTQVRELNN